MTAVVQQAAAPTAVRPGADGRLLGTAELVRLALRRDRVLLLATIAGAAGMAGLSAATTVGLYPDPAQRFEAAATVNSTAALVALYGRIYDPESAGALSMFKLTAFGAAIVAVVMIIVVVRHTRGDEEAGRLELLGSARVGRAAPLAAALIVAVTGSAALGLATAAALAAAGLPLLGSLAFGAGWALAGVSFAAVAGVAAQLTVSARSATGLSIGVLAIAYALRAVGDLAQNAPGWQSWLSPIGWTQQMRAYAGEQWWVLLLPLALLVVLVPLAVALRERRDLGAGMVPERAGPAHGRIGGPLGLAVRLQRGVLTAWVLGFAVFGAVLGSIVDSISGFLDSPQFVEILARLGGTDVLTDAFLAAEFGILAMIATAFGLVAVGRLREEEEDGHAEALLATPVARLRWASGHLAIAVLGTALLMVVAGAAIGVGYFTAVPDPSASFGELIGAALARLPAALIVVGLAVCAFGWVPRWAGAAWAGYALAVALGEFGVIMDLPQWIRNVSPFTHSPVLPSQTASLAPLLPMTAIAVVLLLVGLIGWRRRDTPA